MGNYIRFDWAMKRLLNHKRKRTLWAITSVLIGR